MIRKMIALTLLAATTVVATAQEYDSPYRPPPYYGGWLDPQYRERPMQIPRIPRFGGDPRYYPRYQFPRWPRYDDGPRGPLYPPPRYYDY